MKTYVLYSKTLKQFVAEYPQDGNVQWGDIASAERYDLENARAARRMIGSKNITSIKLSTAIERAGHEKATNMKTIDWTATLMYKLGWTFSAKPTHEAIDAAASDLAIKNPKSEKEIEQSRLSLHDTLDNPAKF